MPMDISGLSMGAQIGRASRSAQVCRASQVVPARAQNQTQERPGTPGFPRRNDWHDPFFVSEVPSARNASSEATITTGGLGYGRAASARVWITTP